MIDKKGTCWSCARVLLHDDTGWWHRNGARVCSDRSSVDLKLGRLGFDLKSLDPVPVELTITEYDGRPWTTLPAGVEEIRVRIPERIGYCPPSPVGAILAEANAH